MLKMENEGDKYICHSWQIVKYLQRDASILVENLCVGSSHFFNKTYTFPYKPPSWPGQTSRKVLVKLCVEELLCSQTYRSFWQREAVFLSPFFFLSSM